MDFNKLIPELSVSNLNKSLDFYKNCGFEINYERPENKFAFISLEGSQMMLQEISENDKWAFEKLNYPFGNGVNFQIEVKDVDNIYKRLNAIHYPIAFDMEENWYRENDKLLGNKEFLVQDPDGYLLRFCEDLGEEMFDLVDELKNYSPMDKVEEGNVRKVLGFLKSSTNCFDRSNLGGHITAGGLVVDMKGNVLLNHHKKTGMWFQFGGHSDGEENSLDVAKREIKEECGLDNLQLISNKIFDVDVQKIDYSAKKNEPEHYHYDINFLFCTNNKNFKVSNESTEIKWVTIKEAKKLINKDDYAMKRMLEKYERLVNYAN